MFVVGIFLAFNQAFLSKKFAKKFGEKLTLLIGVSLCGLGLISITLTNNLYAFIAFYYIMNLGLSLTFPMFSTLIALNGNPAKQGETMGISESITSLSNAIFPVIASTIYMNIGEHIYYIMVLFPIGALVVGIKLLDCKTSNEQKEIVQ